MVCNLLTSPPELQFILQNTGFIQDSSTAVRIVMQPHKSIGWAQRYLTALSSSQLVSVSVPVQSSLPHRSILCIPNWNNHLYLKAEAFQTVFILPDNIYSSF